MYIPIQLAFILKCHHLVGCIIITKYKSNSNHGQYLGVCTWCCTEHFLTSSGGSWECAILLHFVFSLRWLTVDACDLRLRWPMDFDTTCLPVNPWFFFARRRVSDLLSGSVSTLEMMGEHRRQRRTRQLLVSILYACWGALHGTILLRVDMSAVELPVVEPGPDDLLCPCRGLLWGQHESELTISQGIDNTDLFLWLGDVPLLRTLPCWPIVRCYGEEWAMHLPKVCLGRRVQRLLVNTVMTIGNAINGPNQRAWWETPPKTSIWVKHWKLKEESKHIRMKK